jgi:hypothetical protein
MIVLPLQYVCDVCQADATVYVALPPATRVTTDQFATKERIILGGAFDMAVVLEVQLPRKWKRREDGTHSCPRCP